MLLRQAIHTWLAYLTTHYSTNTNRNYKRALWEFASSLPGDIGADNITPEHIERFLLQDCAKSSLNTKLIALKSFFHWLEDRHSLPNPTKGIRWLKATYHRRFLSEAEFQRALAVCRTEKETAVLQLLATTGLRAFEADNLVRSRGSIQNRAVSISGKGGRERIMPLCETARKSLACLYLLKSLPRSTQDNICRRLSHRAGILEFSPHSLRRLFANRMRKHVDIFVLSKLMGHSSISITQAYLQCEAQELAGVTDVLDPPDEPC